ncbi:MAG: hypothetical protein OES24_20320 [Acidimicrobiia bacterium]|nr:hypothetical protein [Acidimicrobiia bacterium]
MTRAGPTPDSVRHRLDVGGKRTVNSVLPRQPSSAGRLLFVAYSVVSWVPMVLAFVGVEAAQRFPLRSP